jgi:quinol monooxygenase YgiN
MPYDIAPVLDTSSVVELRQYTMQPGKREALVELFDRHFTAGQETSGMRIQGTFRDASDPDRYVWLRGFPDMEKRSEALKAFYGGPLWKEHRTAANATIADSSDVLLLKPVDDKAGFALPKERGSGARVTALVVATIYLLQAPVDASFLRFFEDRVRPVMTATGSPPIARFQTESAENTFPALPVRAGEHAFVWFSAFESAADYDRHLEKLGESPAYPDVGRELGKRLKSPVQKLKLVPTRQSLIGPGPGPATGSPGDFDFLVGEWNAKNRRLKKRGVGSSEWDEFPATLRMTSHLGGAANVDEIAFPTKGWSGMTVRTFDHARRQWAIYWINSKSGHLQSPVHGGFSGDTGVFHGDDEDEGRPIRVVFHWAKLGPDAARWSQDFSYDGGRTWETNWVIELTRTSP